MKLRVGDPVERPDGSSYIPLFKPEYESGLANIVCRVELNAFSDMEAAKTFANMIALSYAQCTEVLSFGMGDPDLAHNLQQIDDYKLAVEAYGEVVHGKRYQQFRFLEEAFELIQATQTDIPFTLVDLVRLWHYVQDRPVGRVATEIGDVQITLNIFAMVLHISVARERNNCLAGLKNRTPEQFRVKDKAKMDAGLI